MCFTRLKPLTTICGLLALVLWLPGCAFEKHRRELVALHARGEYATAAALLDSPKVHARYGDDDEVLWRMDRGSVALALGDIPGAVEHLNAAATKTEFDYEKGAGEQITQWLLNDTAVRYIVEPYEDMYLSVMQMVALLAEGRVQPGAANEARRFGTRANFLRDRYNQQVDAVGKQGGRAVRGRDLRSGGGEFVESPLGAYLASLAFMAAGETDGQRIAADHLIDGVRRQQSLVGPVNEADFAGLAQLTPESANVVAIAFSGRGPTKRAERLPPIVIDKVNFYVEIPVLEKHPSRVGAARIEFAPVNEPDAQARGGSPAAPRVIASLDLKLVEDLSSVAGANYDRTMPLVQGRAIARAAAKAGAAYAITETVDKSSHRNDTTRWLTQLGLLAAQIGTERADIRCWTFLPGQARVGTLHLDPGRYRYRVVYSGGTSYASPWRELQVGASPLVAAVAYYWD